MEAEENDLGRKKNGRKDGWRREKDEKRQYVQKFSF